MPTANKFVNYRPLAVVPPVVCNHPGDVVEVKAISSHSIWVRFHDGTAGVVDLGDRLAAPDAGVFASLADPELFAGVGIELGAVTWPNGVDLAPDNMYKHLREDGEWILS